MTKPWNWDVTCYIEYLLRHLLKEESNLNFTKFTTQNISCTSTTKKIKENLKLTSKGKEPSMGSQKKGITVDSSLRQACKMQYLIL